MGSLVIRMLLSLGPIAVTTCVFAQSESIAPTARNLTDREARGKHLFLQNCSLCHLATYAKMADWKEADSTPRPVGPRLTSVLKDATPGKEKGVRIVILNGSDKMPGFQYALQPKQVDDLIAYMKTL
jgi:mono/diheme cytochrome c family protein